MATESIYTCRTCSTAFISHNSGAKYCSWDCKRRGMLCADPDTCKRMYAEGKSQRTIASELGVSQRAVLSALHYAGVQCRKRKRDIDPTIVRKLYVEGLTQSELGRKFNVTKKAIQRVFAEAGIQSRRPGGAQSRQLAGFAKRRPSRCRARFVMANALS